MKPIKFDHWAGVVSVSFLKRSHNVSLHSDLSTPLLIMFVGSQNFRVGREYCRLPGLYFLRGLGIFWLCPKCVHFLDSWVLELPFQCAESPHQSLPTSLKVHSIIHFGPTAIYSHPQYILRNVTTGSLQHLLSRGRVCFPILGPYGS